MPYSPMEIAHAMLHAADLDGAIEALEPHLAAAPDDDEARRLLADLYARLPDTDAPRRALDTSAPLVARGVATHDDRYKRAVWFDKVGEFNPALDELTIGRGIHPTQAEDVRDMTLAIAILERMGRIDDAREYVRLMKPTRGWRTRAGELAARAGDAPAAIAHFTAALDMFDNPSGIPSPPLHAVERGSGGEDPFTSGLRADLLVKRADVCAQFQRYAEAEADYLAAERLIADPSIAFKRGLSVFARAGLRAALPICRDALDAAAPGVRDRLRAALHDDPAWRPLLEALLP